MFSSINLMKLMIEKGGEFAALMRHPKNDLKKR